MNDFLERIGGVLVAPRRTMARLAAGEARAADVWWLILARVLAGELDRMVGAVAMMRVDSNVGLRMLFATFAVVVPDVCGILVAGIVTSFFVPRRAPAFELAGYAWIPYLATTLAGVLYFTARQVAPSPTTLGIIQAAGVAWGVAVWTLSLLAARRRA